MVRGVGFLIVFASFLLLSSALVSANPLCDWFGILCPQLAPCQGPSCPTPVPSKAIIPPQCSDGIDNDRDGKIDYPADCSCTSTQDNDESDRCLDTANAIGPISEPAEVPLWNGVNKIYFNDTIDKHKQYITSSDFPTVLRSGAFNGNVNSNYQQSIRIGNMPTRPTNQLLYGQEPTSDNDPIDYFDRSTIPAPTMSDYIASVTFSTPVNFNHPSSKGKPLKIFNKQFFVDNRTDALNLVLRTTTGGLFWFADGREVRVGIDQEAIDGTQVDFDGNMSIFNSLHIFVSAPDSDNDALTEALSIVDPVFHTFEFDYRGLDIPLDQNHSQRERISVVPVGNDKIQLSVRDHRGLPKTFNFVGVYNNSLRLAYGPDADERIRVIEMIDVQENDYVVVGNEDDGYLLEVQTIYNATTGYQDDRVTFRDVFSGSTFDATITSEGHGTVNVGGRTYALNYVAPFGGLEYVRLNYPDSPNTGRGIFYPTIETSKGAKMFFYQPFMMQLNTLPTFYGGSLNGPFYLQLPDGDGYTETAFFPLGSGRYLLNYTGGSGVLDTTSLGSQVSFPVGELMYKVKGTGTMNRTELRLLDSRGTEVALPGLVFFEEEDDANREEAIIVTIEGNGTDFNGLGVADVQSTWAGTDMFNTWVSFESNDDLRGKVDRYASWAILDTFESDQYKTSIHYPDTQAYARVYAVEIF